MCYGYNYSFVISIAMLNCLHLCYGYNYSFVIGIAKSNFLHLCYSYNYSFVISIAKSNFLHLCYSYNYMPVRRGGSRGFGRTPFLAGYTYYLCDTLTLDESLVRRTGARDLRLLAYNNYSYAHRKASGVARLRGLTLRVKEGGSGPEDGRIHCTDDRPRPIEQRRAMCV